MAQTELGKDKCSDLILDATVPHWALWNFDLGVLSLGGMPLCLHLWYFSRITSDLSPFSRQSRLGYENPAARRDTGTSEIHFQIGTGNLYGNQPNSLILRRDDLLTERSVMDTWGDQGCHWLGIRLRTI